MKHDIFISYADHDKATAESLKSILRDRFADGAWLRDFDLNAGDIIANAVEEAIADSKWFVLIFSKSSADSKWLTFEADLAMVSSMEKNGFEVVIVKLDKSPFPQHLVPVLRQSPIFDISRSQDPRPDLMRVADHIQDSSQHLRKGDIYVDRGNDRDKFSLLLRRNKILFVLGLAGIGKTAFVRNSAAEAIGKVPLEIKITKGHSTERLAREILRATRSEQPLDEHAAARLLPLSIAALRAVEGRAFLHLNYAEDALNTSNQMLPYLAEFLESFASADINTHVIIASTRNPEVPVSLARVTTSYLLPRLDDQYIQECLRQWIEGDPRGSQKFGPSVYESVSRLAAGHPLAARFIAMHLKVMPPALLLSYPESRRVQLRLGSFLLESIDKEILGPIHHLMLRILAVIREPMSLEDMLVFSDIKKHPIIELQQARARLVEILLIDQTYELMSLNSFLSTYYQDQVDAIEGFEAHLAHDFGEYAYNKALELKRRWKHLVDTNGAEGETIATSNDIFRYAVIADRLLRLTDKEHLVKQLPVTMGGTVRELVIHFYQHRKNYRQALRYSEEWLHQHPGDEEIALYQIRCYRNIEDKRSLEKADAIITTLEQGPVNTPMRQRLLRERALIAEKSGDFNQAEAYYRQGIALASKNPYPENHIGLAHLLLRKLDWKIVPFSDEVRVAREAVSNLEVARNQSPVFDRFHLTTYIDALLRAGEEKLARPLLDEALWKTPLDHRLNLRMAEILRDQQLFDEAEEYAKKALSGGATKAALTLANIAYSRARDIQAKGDLAGSKEKLREALRHLKAFVPEYGHDAEVRDGITSKVYRELGQWEQASQVISEYTASINPYTIYEQTIIAIHEADSRVEEGDVGGALKLLESIVGRITGYKSKELPQDLARVLDDAMRHIEALSQHHG